MAATPQSGSKRPYNGDVLHSGPCKRPHLSESLADLRITSVPPSSPESSASVLQGKPSTPFGVASRENSVFFGATTGNPPFSGPASIAADAAAPLNLDSRLAQPLLSASPNAAADADSMGAVTQNLEEVLVDMMAGDEDSVGATCADGGREDADASCEVDMTDSPSEISSRALILYRQPTRPRNVASLVPLHVRESASSGGADPVDSWFVRHAQDRVKRRMGDLAVVPYRMKRLMIGSSGTDAAAVDEAKRTAPPVVVAKWITEDEAMEVEDS